MRISLSEIQETERYIMGTMSEGEVETFQLRMRRDPLLQINVIVQGKVMTLIKMYHRKRMKMELEEVHERLNSDPLKATWRERVASLFHK